MKLESKTFALQTEGRVEKGQVGVKRGCWAGTPMGWQHWDSRGKGVVA